MSRTPDHAKKRTKTKPKTQPKKPKKTMKHDPASSLLARYRAVAVSLATPCGRCVARTARGLLAWLRANGVGRMVTGPRALARSMGPRSYASRQLYRAALLTPLQREARRAAKDIPFRQRWLAVPAMRSLAEVSAAAEG